jgi:hypothetical protein
MFLWKEILRNSSDVSTGNYGVFSIGEKGGRAGAGLVFSSGLCDLEGKLISDIRRQRFYKKTPH